MKIPNKFNGYSRDGIRLYNDPVTAGIVASGTTTMAGTATLMSGAAIAGGTSLASGMALGTSLYGGGLGGLTGSGAFGTAAFDAAALGGAAPAVAPAATGIASGFNAPNYLASLQTPVTAPVAPFQADVLSSATLNPTLSPSVSPALNPVNSMVQTTPAVSPVGTGVPTVEGFTNGIASGYGANPIITQAPVVPTTVATTPVVPPVAEVVTKAPVTEVVEAVPYVESNPLVHSARPTDFKLATDGATKEAVAAAKSNMTGNAWNDAKALFDKPNWANIKDFASEHPYITSAAGLGAYQLLKPKEPKPKETISHIRPYENTRVVSPTANYYTPYSNASTAERNHFTGGLQALPIYRAAEGGLTSLAVGGPVETMSAENAVGQNLNYPQADLQTSMYSNPMGQRPTASNVINQGVDTNVDPYTGEERLAAGGLSGLGMSENTLNDISAARNSDPDAMNVLRNSGYQMTDLQKYGTGYAVGGLSENAGTEVGKMMGASKGSSTGEYKYSYDPTTQQFTQLNDPVAEATQKAASQPSNIGGGGLGSTYGYGGYQQPTPKVAPKPFVPIVTGGIAQLPTQPEAQAPVQQAAPMQIPAYQTPEQQLGLGGFYGYMDQQLADMRGAQGMAAGGLSHLGGYSDGGRLLRGPGDGVSDSIPASIGDRQPARLADGEFVVPARIVSEIGNGSTEAGARKLYAMMERVQSARKKSVGKGKVAVNSKADRLLPA
jgi:hypothetical protein